MDRSNNVPLPKIYTFKSTCKKCQFILGKKLSELEPSTAVYTLEVVGEAGKLTIKNEVNREKVVETTGQEQQLSCEDHETPTNEKVEEKQPQTEKENNNAIASDDDNNQEQVYQRVFKGFEGLEVHEMAKTKGLTRLELSQNLKMTFSDEKNIDSSKGCDNNKEAPSQGEQNCSGGTSNASLHESKAKDDHKSLDDASKTCRMM